MKLISVNVGQPRAVTIDGETVLTGIYKRPVHGPLMLRTLNLDGDRQADLSVHGGVNKAVYAYPSEHYAFWREQLPDVRFDWGQFGENFTVEGLLEDQICLGDQFRIGEAEVVVTQPRLPCFKLAHKFGRKDMIQRFLDSRRTGFYLAVVREGRVEAGNRIEWTHRDPQRVTIADVVRLYAFDRDDRDTLARIVQVEALPDNWRRRFRKRLEEIDGR